MSAWLYESMCCSVCCSDGSPVSPTATVEHMPPLLSYEEDGIAGRSPSLHSTSLLTEQQQVSRSLYAMYGCDMVVHVIS